MSLAFPRSYHRLSLNVVLAALLLFASIGTALADDATYLSVDSLPPQSLGGAATFSGIAVNCTTGQPPIRVIVYDGENATAPYVADASIDTVRDVSSSCAPNNVPSNTTTGFRLIYDTGRLSNGAHSLTFVATYAGGATNSTTIAASIYNGAPISLTTPSVVVLTPRGAVEVNAAPIGYDYVSPNTYLGYNPYYMGVMPYYNGVYPNYGVGSSAATVYGYPYVYGPGYLPYRACPLNAYGGQSFGC
ncbi:MAG: hypothetical protein HW416_2834 [Chloroflexi bacterium]|nr:hypothetical protein [Chloroflexota bacterium]